MPDEYGEIQTRLENLPTCIRGLCYHDDDGRCYVILNARLTREANAGSYDHELGHITRGEMYDPTYREYGKENLP